MMIRAAVAGGTGYAGAEIIRILSGHPEVEITAITSRQFAGQPFERAFPAMAGRVPIVCEEMDETRLGKAADIVFLSLPHKLPMAIVPKLLERGCRVVDLSADFRFRDAAVYEAARVDGAGRLATLRDITLPLLRRVLLIALLFRTLDALRAFDLMFVLTGGGPASTTETLTVYAYRSLFQTLQLGFGAAVGVVVFGLVMLVAWGYLRALRRAGATA
jgi:ABC-type uncharacterized transport system permease subunit